MSGIKVLCITSDKYSALLRPFAHLFRIFWSELQPVTVLGAHKPDFSLPDNFEISPIGAGAPANQWSDTLILYLRSISDSHVVIMLEDYFLCRMVDHNGIRTLHDYCQARSGVLRMDLTNDRLHSYGDSRNAKDIGAYGHYDILTTTNDTAYQCSLQAAIWNRENLLSVLQPGKTPWEFEIHTGLQERPDLQVCGTHQIPMRYANAVLKGAIAWDQLEKLPEPQRGRVAGWIKGWKAE